jgi:hypothetical protein
MEVYDEPTNTVYNRVNTHHSGELLCHNCCAEGRQTQLGNRLYQFIPIKLNSKVKVDTNLYCSLKCYKCKNQ